MQTFGERLRIVRTNAGITQNELAAKVGLQGGRSIRQYESGDAEPTLSRLLQLAKILNVSIDYLVGKAESGLPDNEAKILSIFREVPQEKQTQILAAFQNMVDAIK